MAKNNAKILPINQNDLLSLSTAEAECVRFFCAFVIYVDFN